MLTWIKSHKFASAVAIALVIFGAYRYNSSRQATYQEYQVIKSNIQETLELSGKVVSGTSAELRFSAGGQVTYLGAKEGDGVKKWQTLASIDSRQLQKTLDQKLNLYSIQRGTFDQTVDDNDNSIPDGDLSRTLRRLLEKNQYQLDNTVKDVEYLNLSLTLSRLTSPIEGILVSAPIDSSNVQVLATDIWRVVDPSSLYFSADLDETDLKRVQTGQKVNIMLDAFPDELIESEVKEISFAPKEISSGTTYEVKLALPASLTDKLRLGLNGTAAIVLQEKDSVLTLPSSALLVSGGKTTVLIKEGNKYQEIELTTALENDGNVEITNGLVEGQRVYIKD